MEREALLTSALLDAADGIESGRGPLAWERHGGTAVTIGHDRTLHVDARIGRGFTATLVSQGRSVSLTCPMVDAFDDLVEPEPRAVAHARWAARVLSSPRTRSKDATWVRVATDLAALAATLHEEASGACTLQPGPSTDPIKVESTRHPGWRLEHTKALEDHVALRCPPYLQVTHGRRTGKDGSVVESVVIGHGPKVMCFAGAQDPMERMRLMVSTGLDPADLFRVDDHG